MGEKQAVDLTTMGEKQAIDVQDIGTSVGTKPGSICSLCDGYSNKTRIIFGVCMFMFVLHVTGTVVMALIFVDRYDTANAAMLEAREELTKKEKDLTNYLAMIAIQVIEAKSQIIQTKSQLQTQIRTLERSVYIHRGVFSATKSTTSSLGMTLRQPLVLDKVQYDLGQDYNPYTGEFFCPTRGVYLFHAAASSMLKLDIIKNSTQIASAFPASGSNTVSVTTVIDCETGDKVWLQFQADHTGSFEATFTGAFLHPTISMLDQHTDL